MISIFTCISKICKNRGYHAFFMGRLLRFELDETWRSMWCIASMLCVPSLLRFTGNSIFHLISKHVFHGEKCLLLNRIWTLQRFAWNWLRAAKDRVSIHRRVLIGFELFKLDKLSAINQGLKMGLGVFDILPFYPTDNYDGQNEPGKCRLCAH